MDLSQTYALDDYFKEMLEMCKWGRFDVLGHLTYPPDISRRLRYTNRSFYI